MSGDNFGTGVGLINAQVTITRDAKEFESIASMPYGSYYHCIAAINANKIFVTGLGDGDDLSFMYSKDTGAWSPMPELPTRRYAMGCGVVRDGVGKSEVVVIGGYGIRDGDRDVFDTVEIFSVEQQTWRTGTTS